MSGRAILFNEADLAARVEAMAREIAEALPERLLAVPIMTGAFIFAADLLRALYRAGVEPEVDFFQVASYGAGTHILRHASSFCATSRPTSPAATCC